MVCAGLSSDHTDQSERKKSVVCAGLSSDHTVINSASLWTREVLYSYYIVRLVACRKPGRKHTLLLTLKTKLNKRTHTPAQHSFCTHTHTHTHKHTHTHTHTRGSTAR